MRKIISLGLLLYSYFLIRTNLSTLPLSIPTHFNAAGEANGWGNPDTLWLLLGSQILITALFLFLPYLGERLPSLTHVGSRRLSDYTADQRVRMLPLVADMAAYLSIVMNLFFIFMLHGIIQAARQSYPHLHAGLPMGFLFVSTLSLIVYYLHKFSSLAKQ